MGKRDKERIQRILEGKEKPVRNEKPTLSEKVIKKVEWATEKIAGKVFRNKGLDGNAAALLRGLPMVRNLPGGIEKVRNEVLRAAEIDVKSGIEKGKTDEEILQPALDSPNYRLLLNEVGLHIDHIKVILKDQRKATK